MQNSRRDFLRSLSALALTPYTIMRANPALSAESSQSDFVFPLSVASGDPAPNGVVIWTRVNPEAIQNAAEPLFFEIARERSFKEPLYRGQIAGENINASRDHTVSVDLSAHAEAALEPYSSYYYRFIYRDVSSRVGHCRTLPSAEMDLKKLRMVQICCQDYSSGHYHAFRHIALEENIDFVVHLGDFIYEYAQFPTLKDAPRSVNLPNSVALTLDDYRQIYRSYRADPDLQRAMERHTWIITADDHETANNVGWDYKEDTISLPPPYHPFSQASAEQRRELKMAAQRAWVEYVPARVTIREEAAHPHQHLSIYRRFAFGRLATLHMTDSRSYRNDPDLVSNPSMLGAEQKNWLIDGMTNSASTWQIWGNQTLLGQFGVLERLTSHNLTLLAGKDAWDGYPEERRSILEAVNARTNGRLLVLTGDQHSYISSLVKISYNKASNRDDSNIVGVEVMTPALTSPFFSEIIGLRADRAEKEGHLGLKEKAYRIISDLYAKGGFQAKFLNAQFKLWNPHIVDFGGSFNGYTVMEVDAERASWTVYQVDRRSETLPPKIEVRVQSYDPKDRDVRSGS